jgi:tetratricopeptide (TPR) repeat protein
LDRLEAEHDNLRTALGWSLQQPEVEPPLRLAADLTLFWHTHGHLSEGRAWLERTISASSATTDSHTRAKALNGAGWIAMFQGEYEAARALLEKALALFRELEDEDGVVTSITNLGLVAVLGERQDIPVPALLREAMGLRSKLTNPRTVASLLILSGLVSFAQGDAERAWESHEESLAICRETGNAGGMIVCLTNLGLMAVGRADKARALALLEGETNLTQTPDIIESDPAWSPDGSRIAFVVGTVQQENASIWAMNADGSEQTQITDGPFDFAPNWSPDGAKITFIGPGDGGSDVWVMNADGTAKARINPGAGSVEAQPDWQSLVGNPGTLQFDPATYAVGEAAGTSTITVTRTNGSGGAISVDYASSDGTASAASNYTAASGTLDFAAGQASKTFTVPILNDAGNEPDETVNLTLSNPTGGATLGGQSTVVLTITDDDPPNQAPTVAVARGGTCGASDMRGTINLAVADPDDSPQNLTLSATSSDQSVVPDGNISFAGGTDASRTLTVAAIRGSGTSTVTVTVSDGDLEASVPVKVGVGSDANNTLTGSAEADMIFARRGNDTASGQGANDLLCGSNSKDKLGGGEGDDTLRGGGDNDKLTGGARADHFGGGSGTDTAIDFNAAEGDTRNGIP